MNSYIWKKKYQRIIQIDPDECLQTIFLCAIFNFNNVSTNCIAIIRILSLIVYWNISWINVTTPKTQLCGLRISNLILRRRKIFKEKQRKSGIGTAATHIQNNNSNLRRHKILNNLLTGNDRKQSDFFFVACCGKAILRCIVFVMGPRPVSV